MYSKFLTLVLLLAVSSLSGAAPFAVDSTLDEIDANPGDSICSATPTGVCTLRATIMEANASRESDSIALPAGVFTLSLAGVLEDDAATGDLGIMSAHHRHDAATRHLHRNPPWRRRDHAA